MYLSAHWLLHATGSLYWTVIAKSGAFLGTAFVFLCPALSKRSPPVLFGGLTYRQLGESPRGRGGGGGRGNLGSPRSLRSVIKCLPMMILAALTASTTCTHPPRPAFHGTPHVCVVPHRHGRVSAIREHAV